MTGKNTSYFLIFGFFSLLLAACDWGKNPYEVDVTNIQADLKIKRFEKDLNSIDTAAFDTGLQELESKYPVFYPVFKTEIFGWSPRKAQSDSFSQVLKSFLYDPYVQEVYDTVNKIFGDFKPYEKELELAFRHFKYYFPNKPLPEIVTFVSNFTYASFTIDSSVLAIGLDMFLGADFKYYPSLFPQYLSERLTPDYLTANAMQVMGSMMYDIQPENNTLLSQMIAAGKDLYFVDRMMPKAEDHLKIGYTAEQLQWCKDNEAQVWSFFIERDLLYNTNSNETAKFLNPGPSTPGMPSESPGKVGVWTGWQIVRRFMLENPEVTLDELMYEYDAQQILSGSKYRPA